MINNSKLIIKKLIEDLNIVFGAVPHIIVNDRGLRRGAAKLVTKNLGFMKKRERVDIAKDVFSRP